MRFFLAALGLLAGLACGGVQAQQNWTINVIWPADNDVDIPHGGQGPDWQWWVSRLVQRQLDGREILLETDSGTVNGGGIWAGEWTRLEAGAQIYAKGWPKGLETFGRLFPQGGQPLWLDSNSHWWW